jgi:hypothetical protein
MRLECRGEEWEWMVGVAAKNFATEGVGSTKGRYIYDTMCPGFADASGDSQSPIPEFDSV